MINLNDKYFKDFEKWFNKTYEDLDPNFFFYEDEENDIIINEFLKSYGLNNEKEDLKK